MATETQKAQAAEEEETRAQVRAAALQAWERSEMVRLANMKAQQALQAQMDELDKVRRSNYERNLHCPVCQATRFVRGEPVVEYGRTEDGAYTEQVVEAAPLRCLGCNGNFAREELRWETP